MEKSLYDTDFAIWIESTVKALENEDWQSLDIENLINEIQSLLLAEKKELRTRTKKLLTNIILLDATQGNEARGIDKEASISSISEEKDAINYLLEDSPSLYVFFSEILQECYEKAKRNLSIVLDLNNFPEACPYSKDDLLN